MQTTSIRDIASKEEYERAIRDTNFEFQRLKYMSDGLKVTAYLYKPTRVSGNKLPAIMHGGADWSVTPSQSLTIAQKLQSLGKTYELIIYAGDGHRLARNQEDRDRRAVAWFRKHMRSKV